MESRKPRSKKRAVGGSLVRCLIESFSSPFKPDHHHSHSANQPEACPAGPPVSLFLLVRDLRPRIVPSRFTGYNGSSQLSDSAAFVSSFNRNATVVVEQKR